MVMVFCIAEMPHRGDPRSTGIHTIQFSIDIPPQTLEPQNVNLPDDVGTVVITDKGNAVVTCNKPGKTSVGSVTVRCPCVRREDEYLYVYDDGWDGSQDGSWEDPWWAAGYLRYDNKEVVWSCYQTECNIYPNNKLVSVNKKFVDDGMDGNPETDYCMM